MTKSFQLDCYSAKQFKTSVLNPVEEGIMPYMPAGTFTITPSQNGRPVTVTVEIDESAADEIQKQFEELKASGVKPFFSIQHESDVAAFWPDEFFWDAKIDPTGSLVTGIWAKGTWTKSGKEAVEGKDFRSFSPVFFVDAIRDDADKPVHVVASSDAKPNMGALENDPAFVALSPLWARNTQAKQFSPSGEVNAGLTRALNNREKGNMKTLDEQMAEISAANEKLDLKINGLSGKDDPLSKAELKAAKAELNANNGEIQLLQEKAKTEALELQAKNRIESDADVAVAQMVKDGKIPARDIEAQSSWREQFIGNPKLIELQCGKISGQSIVARKVTKDPTQHESGKRASTWEVGWDMGDAFGKYAEIVCANARCDWRSPDTRNDVYRTKGKLALEAAAFYKNVLAKNLDAWQHAPITEIGNAIGLTAKRGGNPGRFALMAADYSDDSAPTNVLGVLSGTLVLQRTLPVFAYKYPELLNLYTDFSDTPGLLNQTETTRIVTQQAVQKYDPTTDGTGRPKGWGTVVVATTTDVSMTLTDYIAVPIAFGQNVLGATTRRLFDEQSVLAIKSIGGYFVSMLTDLCTAAKYNGYAVVGTNGVTVDTGAIPTFVKGKAEFDMGCLDLLDSIFTNGKVPEEDRGLLLTPSYYAKLRGDPRLSFMYAASAKDVSGGAGEFLTEAKLPKLSGFAPYKAPYLPASTPVAAPTTNNVVGFAFQKAAAILKSRLPQEFSQVLGVMIPGSVTTVTDPDTLISIMLVQYINLQGGWAEWRPEVILGAAVGDKRAGLVLTSQ